MSPLVEPARWQPFGTGRIAPAGALTDKALLGRLQTYKREVTGAYRSLPPSEILALLPPGPCLASEKLDGETWFLHRAGDVTTLLSPASHEVAHGAAVGVPTGEQSSGSRSPRNLMTCRSTPRWCEHRRCQNRR